MLAFINHVCWGGEGSGEEGRGRNTGIKGGRRDGDDDGDRAADGVRDR